MAKLDEYRRKRDPGQTPEPFGSKRRRKGPIFVVQRHDARRLHYDFRLERAGALASWAVPKGIPLEPGQRALAVHVEDHPLEYATFEGEIPKGQYGAGTVEIWDDGTYELVEEKRDGGLTVHLHGRKLEGLWTLVPAKLDGDPKNWLLIRKRGDAAAQRHEYATMLATPEEHVPSGPGWLHEIKWDGYRIVSYLRGGEGARLLTRRGQNYTDRFANIARELPKALRTPDAVVDGEVCALDENGRPSFSAMQQAKPGTPIVYYIFDLLELEGTPLVERPLSERRAKLADLVDRRNRTVVLSEAFEDGEALYEAAREQHLEGIVSKRADSPYREGRRTREWLKVKAHGRQEFVIAGYTKGQGRRAGSFGSLVLGVWRGDELAYVGNVGTGFTDKTIDMLLERLRPLERPEPPFAEVPRLPRVRKSDIVWVEPTLVAEVEFVEWTHDGHLRAPSFQGLRDDKPAQSVEREEPLPHEIRKGRRLLKLSNLDKVFWPREGITKGDLLEYYRAVAAVLLPHLRDRPFTMRRYPEGIEGHGFFQKDAPSHMPDWIPRHPAYVSTRTRPPRKKWIQAPLVSDELALLWMVNMGCIDLNTWYSRVDKPDRPDWVLFDLDPAPDVGFPETVDVALILKATLDELGLLSYPKTSGSKGIHVLVPIERRHTYGDTREFSEIVAGAIARANRGLATTEWSKARRRGVLIDANQNGEGKTIASVYSVRPKPGAPVSTPLRWDEVKPGLELGAFTMETVLERVRRDGDLFAGVLSTKQRLDRALASVR
jgi:bifunctional non-homologous end joining protein LigD